jgi:hypothetical protein
MITSPADSHICRKTREGLLRVQRTRTFTCEQMYESAGLEEMALLLIL